MAYNLTTGTPGKAIITIADGTIDTTSTSLALPGRNYSGYGQPVDQDLIRLTEHFASSTQPSSPLLGQIWYDTTVPAALKVCSNASIPTWTNILTNPVNADLTVNGNLAVANNATVAGNLTVGGVINGALQNGVQFVTTGGGAPPLTYNGGVTQTVSYNTVGAAQAANLVNYYAVGISNVGNTTGANPTTGNLYGAWTFPVTMQAAAPSSTLNGTWILGAGATLQATYADLAERHHSDAPYPVGTVVKVGGVNEITIANAEDQHDVLGVVSNTAAYLMNANAGDDSTHPQISAIGRVPVRVVGSINKGDKITTGDGGCAVVSTSNVGFGWALESNQASDEKLVLCVIK